jgi:drug/metabolite transporter (DMT)-like permease
MNAQSAPTEDGVGVIRPVFAVALAIAVLSAMDAAIKTLGPHVPVTQIVFLRYLAGAVFALPVFLFTGPHRVTRKTIETNGLRAVVMLVAAWTFFYAITRLPLVEAVTLAFTAPLFVVVLARPLLSEPIQPRALVAVGIGLAGVAIVVSADASAEGRGVLTTAGVVAALVSAVTYALGIVLLRKHSASTPIPVMVFSQAVIAALLAAPFAIAIWQPISVGVLAAFLLVGFLGTAGHLFMAWGFSRANAGSLAPLEYTGFLWALLFGLVLFGETPAPATYLGALAIIIGCWVGTRRGWPVYPRRRYIPPHDPHDPSAS